MNDEQEPKPAVPSHLSPEVDFHSYDHYFEEWQCNQFIMSVTQIMLSMIV